MTINVASVTWRVGGEIHTHEAGSAQEQAIHQQRHELKKEGERVSKGVSWLAVRFFSWEEGEAAAEILLMRKPTEGETKQEEHGFHRDPKKQRSSAT